MKKSLQELDEALDELSQEMPQLLRDTTAECQMETFAGIADEIREATPPEHQEHVWSRLQCILREARLIPGDDEPCSEA